MGESEQNKNQSNTENEKPLEKISWKDYLIEFFKEIPVSTSVVLISLVLFIITAIKDCSILSFQTSTLIAMGGAYNIKIYEGEYWRILTSTFLHDGIFHLISNLFFLFLICMYAEIIFGKIKFLLLLLSTSIFSEGISFYLNSNRAIVSVGLSGALLGIFGAIVMFGIINTDKNVRKDFLNLRSLLLVVALILGGSDENVNTFSHIGGFIAGICLAAPYSYIFNFLKHPKTASIIFYIITVILMGLTTWIIKITPQDVYKFTSSMKQIIYKHEQMVKEWDSWYGASYIETRPKAIEHIKILQQLADSLNANVINFEVGKKLVERTNTYIQLLKADITYLQLLFHNPEYQSYIYQDSIQKVLGIRDSLFNKYWE